MCSCDPPCEPFTDPWHPTETCPNPECPAPPEVKPVGIHPVSPSVLGFAFHCTVCPCRWYNAYEVVDDGGAAPP